MTVPAEFDVVADLPSPPVMRAVEASAGTGKTYSITTTIVRLVIEDGLELDRLLVATFTRAATADLVDRTRRRLLEAEAALQASAAGRPLPEDCDANLTRIVEDVDDGAGERVALDRVRDALGRIDEAVITTIHGFCHRVLSAAAFSAGVETGLELETDDARLIRETVDDWAVALLHDATSPFVSAVEQLHLKADDLRDIGRAVAQEPDLVTVPEGPDPRDPHAVFAEAWTELRRALLSPDEVDELCEVADAVIADGEGAGRKWNASTLRKHAEQAADAVLRGESPKPTGSDLQRLHPDGDTNSRGQGMPGRVAATAVPRAVATYVAALDTVEGIIRSRLGHHVRDALDARRAERGTASFADLLRRCDEALTSPRAAQLVAELRGSFDAVLVDEFQDTDPVQWRILRRLFGRGRHFDVVGDPKQAIYGWRGADLQTYLDAVEHAGDQLYTMQTNWRSDEPYVAACNAILAGDDTFSTADHEQAARVGYIEVEHAEPNAGADLRDEQGRPRSGVAFTFHDRGSTGVLDIGVATQRAVGHAVDEIIEVVDAGWTIEGRPVGAGDCAVLTRTKVQARAVVAELQRRDVPAVLGGGRDVLETPDADDVAALLEALLSPTDDRALRRVLVGPFVGLDANGVAGLDDAERADWFDHLASWSRSWSHQGVAAAVAQALRDGGGEHALAGLRSGERTLTNLRHVAEVLHRAEQEESLGPHALAAWFALRRAEVRDPDHEVELPPEERELRLERDADAVRVLTIHASKGLEFPLVWLPFAWACDLKEPNRASRTRPFTVNDPERDGQRVLSLLPAATDQACEDPEYLRLRRLWRQAEWEAGHRLAYVALTRAEHRCVVHVGGVKDVQDSSLWHLLFREPFGTGGPLGAPPLPDDETLVAHLERLGEDEDAAHVEVRRVHGPGGDHRLPRDPSVAEGDDLEVQEWSRRKALDVHWGRASYSGLMDHGGRAAPQAVDEDAADHDDDARFDGPGPLADEELTGGAVPLEQLPRGADWGTFVHDVLEHADFDAEVDELATLVNRRSLVTGFAVDDEQRGVLARGLHDALRTPLRGPLGTMTLADVPRDDRLDELEFVLGLASRDEPVDLHRLGEVFTSHAADASDGALLAATGRALARRAATPVHGVLTGFIDLTFRVRPDGHEQWWIADYKTNGLGQRRDDGTYVEVPAHQHPDRVRSSMVDKGYVLQAHLYLVALHRFLQARLDDYDYARHVGGWAYLYLRGMTGPDSAVAADGRAHGIAVGRPAPALVDDLDRVLGGGGL